MAKFIIAALFLACSACKTGAGLGSAPIKLSASSWPEADALFRKDPRWLGGDGAFSVDLGGERTLWLFGDSFVATSAANERAESKMVRNSIAVQTGRDPVPARPYRTDALRRSAEPGASDWKRRSRSDLQELGRSTDEATGLEVEARDRQRGAAAARASTQ